LAYVILAVIVGLFNLARQFAIFGGGYAFLFSQGLLMAYAFTAVTRVSNGDLTGFIPEITDISDLLNPLRLGLAAFLASSAPLILVVLLAPGIGAARLLLSGSSPAAQDAVVHAQANPGQAEENPPTTEATPGRYSRESPFSAGEAVVLLILFIAGLLWKLIYSPIALTVAALNRTSGALSGFLQTLNPVLGIQCIARMGSVYWQAMGVYTAVTIVQLLFGAACGLIPFFGGFFRAFVDCYAYLVIGCTLGFAVFKKAPELGLD
jgi:hypothetical protein